MKSKKDYTEEEVLEKESQEAHKIKTSVPRGTLFDRKAVKTSRKVTRREGKKPKKEEGDD